MKKVLTIMFMLQTLVLCGSYKPQQIHKKSFLKIFNTVHVTFSFMMTK